jgi:hypothetical protein
MFAMIRPLLPGGPALRGVRRAAGAALLLLALTAPLRVAVADDDPYTATVTVDATADDVAKAREMARLDGQRKALNAVVDRLAGGPGKAKLPKLSDNQITDLVASFEVANEHMTAVRYTADYTYHFQATPVQAMLTKAGISLAGPDATPPPATGDMPPASPANPPPLGPTANLVAVLPINGLDDWLKVRAQVAGLPSIRKVDVQSLSRQEARISIQYAGTLDDLKASLATLNLSLEAGDPWRLTRSDHP